MLLKKQKILIHGHDLVSLNIIPELQTNLNGEDEYNSERSSKKFGDDFTKLKKVRAHLVENYNSEFLSKLIKEAINKKDRYKPVFHDRLKKR